MFSFFFTVVVVGQALSGVAANTDAFAKIHVGSSLHANSRGGPTSWLSPSCRFAFGFYQEGQGLAIGITMYVSPVAEPLVIWTAAGDQVIKPVSKDAVLTFTEEGFFLTTYNGANTTALKKFNGTKPTGAAMLDSGNFMVYKSDPSNRTMNCSSISVQVGGDVEGNSCIIWQSFDNPTDTMMGGQVLICGTYLISRQNLTDTSYYLLAMQCDSNLVLYEVKKYISADGNTTTASDPIWASQTYGWHYNYLLLDEDGHLFLSNSNGSDRVILSLYNPEGSRQAKTLYHATLGSNKYFRLFALNLDTNKSTVVYEIPTLNDDCQTNHLCGMNSYCVIINNRPECRCLPGFNSTNFRDQAKGCQRSIAEPVCWRQGSSDSTVFSMEAVDNLVWYDEAYSIVSAANKEDCSNTCLSECNCEAALFFNQNCAKHKLPISRATKGTNFTTHMSTAYIKISIEGSGRNAEENQRQEKYMAVLLCGVIDAGVFLGLLVAGTGSYWLFYGRYRLMWRKWELAFQEEVAPRSFSFQELAMATSSFTTELGRGGHATVFMGYLTMYGRPNSVPVAVKRFSTEDVKGENDFQAEIKIIGRAHHVNLVRLLGFCYEESKRLLIYEFMSRGSLADLIYEDLSNQSGPPSWKKQASILLGVARGLNYLHRECETKIIHRDIKPENILIAENWNAKISDFGISKLLVGGLKAMSTKRTSAPGTPGYMAPECVQSNGENVTEKADVYSFGIVVLETVFWERNTEANNLLESSLKYCEDIEEKRREKVELADEELEKENMVKLGMLCVQENPDARPDMEDVILSMLEGRLAVPSAAAAVNPQIITSGKKVSWHNPLNKI